MSKDTTLTEPMLWDEIMKALVYTMPEQLFPLIEEVYGITYPKETSDSLSSLCTTTITTAVRKPQRN